MGGAGSGLRWTGELLMLVMRVSPRTFRNSVSLGVT
jgi:hypothetical protein